MKKLILTLLCVILSSCCQATNYLIHDIDLGDAANSLPIKINNASEIVGVFDKDGNSEPFFWSPISGLTVISDIPSGEDWFRIESMNNLGQVVGTCLVKEGWFFKADVKHGFIWSQDSGFIDLGSINGKDTWALDIDDRGRVVLVSEGSCYLWDAGKITKLNNIIGVRSPSKSYPDVVMNNHDQIAFYQDLPNRKGVTHDAKLCDLNTHECRSIMNDLKGIPSVGAINDFGTVVGTIFHYNRVDGFIAWPKNGLQIVRNFEPMSLNCDAVVVGSSYNENSDLRATIFKNGWLSDLTDVSMPADPSTRMSGHLIMATGINDAGAITAVLLEGETWKTVLLVPFEPHAGF